MVDSRGVDQALRAIEGLAKTPDPPPLVTVVGPTASGKTELAVRLAELVGGEIVSCDSVQIYRFFDLGSGKPTAEELARAPHHLIGTLDPLEPIDAALYARAAERAISAVRARGRVPILCGGTFLWVKATLFGLAEAPPGDASIRQRHRDIVLSSGRTALHAQLAEVDPELAARLHPNDVTRVSRGLEVHALTGRPLSAWQREHAFATPRFQPLLLAVRRTPEASTARIAARVRAWLEAGWVDEVRDLVARGYGSARAMGSVGYREVREHLDGGILREALAETITRATRVFARRQRTWLNQSPVTWIDAGEA